MPIISNLPKDNHSLSQLYLDGQKITFILFLTSMIIKNELYKIKLAQKKATQYVLKKKIPFRSFELLKRSETTIGEIFTFFMLETILLGEALK